MLADTVVDVNKLENTLLLLLLQPLLTKLTLLLELPFKPAGGGDGAGAGAGASSTTVLGSSANTEL